MLIDQTWSTLLEQKVAGAKRREVAQCFENFSELKVAGTKSCGTKSCVELIVAQNFKTKSRGNLMSRKIQKLKVAGTKCRVFSAHGFKILLISCIFLRIFPRLKKVALSFSFQIKKPQEQKFAGTKSRGTKSRVKLIVAQNFKTKSRGNLMSRQIRKQKIPGTKSREVAHYFCATISSRDFLFK